MSEKELLSQHDWRRLARTVQSGNCVLVLGPGVAVEPGKEPRTPLTALLARSISDELEESDISAAPDTLAHVAQVYLHQPDRDRVDLELAVADFYEHYKDQTTSLHKELAALPFTLCVTTTPDAFLANAFRQVGKQPLVEYYNYRKERNVRLPEPDAARPVLFSLYGSIEDLDSLVLTESDLQDFLVNVINKTPPLPSLLTARFGDPDISFLFLGFGFHRWYVRILLHVLQAHGHRARSLALEDPGFFADPRHGEMAVFYGREHLIGFRKLSWRDFVTELRQNHEALVGQGVAAPPEPPAEAPLLFLCHAHEDKSAVARLAEQLQALGLRVWLDRQDLRGGDEWDRLIPAVLQKAAYVIVVESPRLQRRVESYVYKEIRIALERQQRFAPGFRYIIPVSLEECGGIEELKQLHAVDISSAAGIRTLVDAINDDWTRRNVAPEMGG